jgi:hypothetical protein
MENPHKKIVPDGISKPERNATVRAPLPHLLDTVRNSFLERNSFIPLFERATATAT